MGKFRTIFHRVEDPRKRNATMRDLIGMSVIALPATLSGVSSCSGFSRATRGTNKSF